jgi:acetyl-CoA acetyltransferase
MYLSGNTCHAFWIREHSLPVALAKTRIKANGNFVVEVMGFCPIGEGIPFVETGVTRLGGGSTINTSGGLKCRGHPSWASGLAQIHEIVTQLRGAEGKRQGVGVRIGLTENGGDNLEVVEAFMIIHILEKI